MLTETLLRIPLSVTVSGQCFLVPTSRWLQGNEQELTCHRRLRVFAAGNWKNI
jgi:hypothetical protein